MPAHTRWLSWAKTLTKIVPKWSALEVYFQKIIDEESDKRKYRKLIKFADKFSSQNLVDDHQNKANDKEEESKVDAFDEL